MEDEKSKSYKVVETSAYNSLFFTEKKGTKENFSGETRKHLVDLLSNPVHKVHKVDTLRELKTPAGKILLLETIALHRGSFQLPFLVAACWESGNDFSEVLPFFVLLAIEEDLPVALEALSVLEEIGTITDINAVALAILTLEKAMTTAAPEKKFLLSEIHKHLNLLIAPPPDISLNETP